MHAREIDLEGCSYAWLSVHPDEATALFDYSINRCQAQSRTFSLLLGGEERFEHPGANLLADADSGVSDCQHHIPPRSAWLMARRVRGGEFNFSGFDGERAP